MVLVSKKVGELAVGNRVDLTSCPYLKNHPVAEHEYGFVAYIAQETPDSVVVGYEGIDHVRYPADTVLQVKVPRDVPDPVVRVRAVGQSDWTDWHISENLTDRWGELNDVDALSKPLELLEHDVALLERLCSQMWGERTFVARKDGQFGVLYELEFCSQESEAHLKDGDPVWYATLRPQATVVSALLAGMAPLAERFPGVQFAVPDETHVYNDRPAAWAFVPDGLLSEEQRQELGRALCDL